MLCYVIVSRDFSLSLLIAAFIIVGFITVAVYGYNNDNDQCRRLNNNIDDEISLSAFSPRRCTTATTVTLTPEVVEAEVTLLY